MNQRLMVDSQALPPKPEVALALLQSAASVYVHLDPRPLGVRVPVHFKKQPQLVLQIGLNMAVPIVDLEVGQDALSCTLSFNRRPEFCRIPWSAVFGLVDPEGRGMIWPDSIPPEVASASEGRSAKAETKKGPGPKRSDKTDSPGTLEAEAAATAKPAKKRRERPRAVESEGAPRANLRSLPGAEVKGARPTSSDGPKEAEIGTSRSEPSGQEPGKKPARPSHLRLVK